MILMLNGFKDFLFGIRHGFKGFPIQVNGQDFRICESLRRWEFGSESEMLSLLSQRLKPGSLFVDIGANFGLHTMVGAMAVGETGQVWSFEPLPDNLRLLYKNISLNKIGDTVRVFESAVSESEADHVSMTNSTGLSVTASIQSGPGGCQVENVRLDQLEIPSNLGLVKIDVEGAELSVLNSARKLLADCDFDILIEIHPNLMRNFGHEEHQLFSLLQSFGYQDTKLEASTSETYQVLFCKSNSPPNKSA